MHNVSSYHLLGINICDLLQCMSRNSTDFTCTTSCNVKDNGQIIVTCPCSSRTKRHDNLFVDDDDDDDDSDSEFGSPKNVMVCFSSQKFYENRS